MQSVRINTQELLAVLRKNRNVHVDDYGEAMEGYREAVIAFLEKKLAEARGGEKIVLSGFPTEPRSYADQYNTVIRMLEMSDDAVVELTAQEFTQYVEDKWGWKDSFSITTAMYKSK